MCGLAGFSGRFSDRSLREAGDEIAHRGPDDAGTYRNDLGIGLAFRRLAIIDLSPLGAQPMASGDGAAVIVFNGEIYNFRELRDDLVSRGASFRSHSDTEVLLQLYLAEGEQMLTRLNGIFAFAIWDARDRSLLVARDALGVKPLYYASTNRGFAFASEIKALVRLVPEVRELDPLALHRYLTFLWCPGAGTPFKGVRKLLPGQAIRVRAGQIERCWSWYRLPFFRPSGGVLNETEAVSGTVEHLRQAVHRQLVSDVPVGAFLSGGLDSSAVVTFAREQAPGIRCFTIESIGDQDAGFTDDLPYARRVAKHLNVPLEIVTVEAGAMADDLEGMVGQLDEPLGDPAPLNVLYISQLARRHGMKVLLSGAGGDDLLSGYRRHVAVHYERYWQWLPHIVRAGLDGATRPLSQRYPRLRRLGKLFNGAGLEPRARLTNYFRWIRESELVALYTPEFRTAASAEACDQPMQDVLAGLPAGTGALNEMLVLEQRFFLADHNLIYTDKMSMAAGVETRVPFLDLDLVDFAARIPERLKQRGSVSKWVLKKAMEPFLPMDVIHRPKTGFGAPLRRWMQGELRPLLGDLLSSESLTRRGIFNADAVHRLVRRNEQREGDDAYTLLSLMSVEIWCRKFIDGAPGAADPPEAVAAPSANRI